MTVSSSASDDDTSSKSSSTSSASSDEEEEQWSLRVRLLSAVDLPPSLSPTVPLCPWFKFGLVEDIVAALESTDDNDNADEHYQQNTVDDQQNNRHSRTILPRRNEHEHSHEQGDSDVMKPKKFTSNTSTITKIMSGTICLMLLTDICFPFCCVIQNSIIRLSYAEII